jgi:D-xylose transport system substrate-binding protein
MGYVYKIITWLLILSMVLAVTGCGQSNRQEAADETRENKQIQIGFSMDSLLIERWQRDRDIFVSRAAELGAEVNLQNANGDVNKQIEQINYFIEKKVDAIVIVAVDCDALSEVISKARKAGIKVIAYDRLARKADVDLYISFDNEKVGELMGDALAEAAGEDAKILVINGPLTDNNVSYIIEGFKQEATKAHFQILETDYAESWTAEKAFTYTSDYLNKTDAEIPDGIMCGNDSLAGQAIKALSERRLAGKVAVVGQDADLDACQRIVEGTQYMTVYKPVEQLAKRAAELVVDLAEGKEVQTEETINDGTYDVPYVKLDPIAVTKDNMDKEIIGTFHQKDEVYMNVEAETTTAIGE